MQLNPFIYSSLIHKTQHCSENALLAYIGELTDFECEWLTVLMNCKRKRIHEMTMNNEFLKVLEQV